MKKQSINAIALLKEYRLEKKPVIVSGNHLVFGNIKLDMTNKTAWSPPDTDFYYEIGALWLFLDFHDKGKIG